MKWEKQDLSSLGEFKNGVNFSSDKIGKGHPLINVKDITDHKFLRTEQLQRVNLELDVESDYFAKEGDIFFVRSSVKRDGAGAAGVLVSLPEPTIHCGFVIRFRPISDAILSKFLLYYLHASSSRDEIRNLASGATIYNISQGALKKLRVPVPPLDIQQKIADILSAYDDLIENNLIRIQLLEEAAQCRYKLLLEEAENDCATHEIIDLCEIQGGGTPSTKVPEYWQNPEVLWFTPTDLTKNNATVLLDSEKKISGHGLRNSSAKLFPAKTIMMTSRASIGFFGVTNKPASTNQGFINILPLEEHFRYFLLFNLKERKEELIANANGSTFLEISKTNFRKLKIKVPNRKELLERFEDNMQLYFDLEEKLLKQNVLLREARNILLPRLMSGEIDVTSVAMPEALIAEMHETV